MKACIFTALLAALACLPLGAEEPQATASAAPAPAAAAPKTTARQGLFAGLPGSLYFAGAMQYYIAPNEPFARAWPGGRAGAGWELALGPGAVSAGVETGWTWVLLFGKREKVSTENLIPFTLRAGYGVPFSAFGLKGIADSFTLRADLIVGGAAGTAHVGHFSALVGFRVGGEYRLGERGPVEWSVFLGAGADFVPQTEGPLSLPALETGAKLRVSLRAFRRKVVGTVAAPEEAGE